MSGLLTVAVATVAIALTPSAATAQEDDWQRRIAEADSIGPEPPRVDPAPGAACGPGVELSDSVQVSGPADEFLSRAASLRTAGYFTRFRLPDEGAGRFALLRVTCDPETGRPVHFALERYHRYFYLGFILRARPTFHSLRFRSPAGAWEAFRWDPERRTFSARADSLAPRSRQAEEISLAAGDTFTVVLASNASTGYRWSLADSLPGELVQLVHHRYRTEGRPRPGAGGHEHWTFRALRPGCATIRLVYSRGQGSHVAARQSRGIVIRASAEDGAAPGEQPGACIR